MLDFVDIEVKKTKNGYDIYPEFYLKKGSDIMVRGGDFYAIWDDSEKLWSTDEHKAITLIDNELKIFADEFAKEHPDEHLSVKYMRVSGTKMIDKFHHYCQRQLRNDYHQLDRKIIFSNEQTAKEDYVSKKLDYPIEEGSMDSYEELISTLYSPEERHKIEWAVGSVVAGESKDIQKFLVFYGAAGTGKSTVLNIIQKIFEGYCSVFDAKALGDPKNQFALEPFISNPLVAIQHDGDLSRIEDNTKLNSLISHEWMTMNEKFKSSYPVKIDSMLFIGTNKPVRITDSKSGIIRRLIDVIPSGKLVPVSRYNVLTKNVNFELGAIANHCREVYLKSPNHYNGYKATSMFSATNDLYNFVLDNYYIFNRPTGTTLKVAWEMYKNYCDEAAVKYPLPMRIFKEDLKTYFKEFKERGKVNPDDAVTSRNIYFGFKEEFFKNSSEPDITIETPYSIEFKEQESLFDDICKDEFAQYATKEGAPKKAWANVKTKLSDIDTSKLHYVNLPENHIVIDFDIPGDDGEKSFEKNLEAANKWPKTYSELSKSEAGIHLHYIYSGDVTKLKREYDKHVEIKVFTGNSALRRKLTKCNDIPIASISSGLPVKEEKRMVGSDKIKSEKGLRGLIERNLNKEIHPGTKPSIDFIVDILDGVYKDGLKYDVSDLRGRIFSFASGSTHHSDYCISRIDDMKFKSDEEEESEDFSMDKPIVFFDCEVKPNRFLICYKEIGEGKTIIDLLDPTPEDIERLIQNPLIGFNNRKYDNHILYARLLGYNNQQLFKLSTKIVRGDRSAFFPKAYNLSYSDVLDFSSEKKGLKKFEIELGIPHKEFGQRWDEPIDDKDISQLIKYCHNDVLATEAVFNHRKADWTARQILADLAGLTYNDTTNTLTTRIIFGKERHPQNEFNYRNLAEKRKGIPYFEGYEFKYGESYYKDCAVVDPESKKVISEREKKPDKFFEREGELYSYVPIGEGGYVYAEPGIYTNVALDDVASMHPTSIEQENLFGDNYTKRFSDIKKARIAIKHKDFDTAREMLDGKLKPYLEDESIAKDLAYGLKIAINSVYGLTSAKFENPFRDIRNIDNIVAKRGALTMVDLKYEVQKLGYTVAHIKTDSIKIPNADDYILKFVEDFGKKYGYEFEHEATYDRMCLVNDAVYIAKLDTGEWTATGTQFQIPYVFKTLFSGEEIEFKDLCETRAVFKGDIYIAPDEEHLDQSVFVGRVGSFCPMKPGTGGGLLYRVVEPENHDEYRKYYAVSGTKGYEWMESETVKELGKEDDIDISYYETLCDKAVKTISKYIEDSPFDDFDDFVHGESR